jgi:4-amino-4-deoxy-L-arabinose transferase-like glycosyltransferase
LDRLAHVWPEPMDHPSALAAIATLAVVMGFTWRLTHSLVTALLACSLLVTSYGFYGFHAAATGDYDATLCFFSTAYVCMLFFTLHRRRPRPVKVLAAGGLVACAVLTKNIAGLIPGTGVVVYILLMRRADTKIFHLVQIGNAYILRISP